MPMLQAVVACRCYRPLLQADVTGRCNGCTLYDDLLHKITYHNMFPCVQNDIRMTGVILGTGDANSFEAPECRQVKDR